MPIAIETAAQSTGTAAEEAKPGADEALRRLLDGEPLVNASDLPEPGFEAGVADAFGSGWPTQAGA
jgi:hypothetical protein